MARRVGLLWCSLICVGGAGYAGDSTTSPSAPSNPARFSDESLAAANGLLGRGLNDLGVEEYRKFLEATPTGAKADTARYGLAVGLFRLQRYDDAATALASLAPDESFEFAADAAMLLGHCHLLAQRYGDAIAAFRGVAARDGVGELKRDAVAGLVEALCRAGRHEEAIKVVGAEPEGESGEPAKRAQFFVATAEAHLGRYKAAAERLQRLPAGDAKGQTSTSVRLLLAQCHSQLGQLDRAEEGFRALVDDSGSPSAVDAMYGLAGVLHRRGKSAEAAGRLDQLLQRFPDDRLAGSARLLRARLHFEANELVEAERLLDECTRDPTVQAEAGYWQAKCRLRSGQNEAAAIQLRAMLRQYPDHPLRPEIRFDLCVALSRLEAHADSLAEVDRWLADYPAHALVPDALRLAASAAQSVGRFDESRRYTDRFLEGFAKHESAGEMVLLEAENEFRARNYSSAAKGFARFADSWPKDARAGTACVRRGVSLYRDGQVAEAEAILGACAGVVDKLEQGEIELTLGEIAFDRGDWKAAESRYSRLLALDDQRPSADSVLLKLGLCLARRGEHTEALATFAQLIERFPSSSHALHASFERGQSLLALERRDEAREVLERVLNADPKSRFANLARELLGSLALEQRDFAKATEWLGEANAGSPTDGVSPESRVRFAQALLASNKFAEAEALAARLKDELPAGLLRDQAVGVLATAMARQDRCDDALEHFARVVRPNRQDAGGRTFDSAWAYEQAWCLHAVGREDDAIAAYRALISSPDGGALVEHAKLDLAKIELQRGRYAAAAEVLRTLAPAAGTTSPSPEDSPANSARYYLGYCEFQTGQFEAAASALGAFLDANPEHDLAVQARSYLAETQYRLGKHAAAAENFALVVRSGRRAEALRPALLRWGECLAVLQRWDESRAAYERYLTEFPEGEHWFQAEFGAGWSDENQQKYEDAMGRYTRVTAKHQGPTAARAQFQIGECLFAMKRHEEAVRAFLKVDILYAYPEWSAAALYEAGRCFEALARPSDAVAQFKVVVERFSDSVWAKRASGNLSAITARGVAATSG